MVSWFIWSLLALLALATNNRRLLIGHFTFVVRFSNSYSNFSQTHKNWNFQISHMHLHYIWILYSTRILGVPDSRLSTRTLHHPFLKIYRSISSDCLRSNIYSPSHLDIWIPNHSIITTHRSSTIRIIYNFQTFYRCVLEFYHWKMEFWNSLLSRW